jgi:alkanesulfonate monooxygenase SsuD/methylene tetrahydromethanopterin reductase-like flavin-dependent oxidoreductase (luciferase family)
VRIGLGIDVSHGHRNDPVPDPRAAADTIDAMLDEAGTAERAGFHSIRCPDRHGRPEIFLPGGLQLLTLVARETHRVALGAYVLPNTLYNPMVLAEQCAVIDTLSRGRLFMGFARGKDYWGYFGIPTERRLGRFLENLRVIETANRGEPFSFHGDFYDIADAQLTPSPYQRPRYPIWGGGAATPAIERCADYAEAWGCNDAPIDSATWDKRVGAYREAARARGKEPFVVLMRNAWVSDNYDAAVEEFGRYYIEHLQFVARRGSLVHIPSLDHPDKITPATIREHAVMGSAQDCIETIEYYRESLGVDYVTLRFRFPEGPSLAASRDQIERFGDEVVAPIHRKYPSPVDHPAIPAGACW